MVEGLTEVLSEEAQKLDGLALAAGFLLLLVGNLMVKILTMRISGCCYNRRRSLSGHNQVGRVV